MTKDDLIAFEGSVAAEFNAGKIRHPVHLESGNEEQLIIALRYWKPSDWVFVTWRSHLKALLAGVPPEELRAAIYRGESMALRFPEYRVYGSAIAGGNVPIALGTALAIKRKHTRGEHVWCFVGDMVSFSGIFFECHQYACNFDLPITFIVEDNEVSVCTPTSEAWGAEWWMDWSKRIIRYGYQSKWPHSGAGKRIEF